MRFAASVRLRVKLIRSKDLVAIYIGSSYAWPPPARDMPRSGECAWATYRISARRLMVREWRGGNSGSDPVPVGDDVIGVLFPKSPGGQAMHLVSSEGSMDRSRGASRGRSLMGNARNGSSCSLDRIYSTDGADIRPLVKYHPSRAEFSGDRRECGRRAARVAVAGLATPISANDRTSRSAIGSIGPRPAAIRGPLDPATLAPQDISPVATTKCFSSFGRADRSPGSSQDCS